jgi:hypothetical protein
VGSNGARVRLWKVELQKLADDTGLVIHVGHIEVEQDRAPAILSHHAELARPAAHQSLGTGLKVGHQGQQGPDEMPRHRWRSGPSLMELHYQAAAAVIVAVIVVGVLMRPSHRQRSDAEVLARAPLRAI